MPKYRYKAINDEGESSPGEIEADSPEIAVNILGNRGLIPTELTRIGGGVTSSGFAGILERMTPVKPPELIIFTKQLKTMLRSGVPMIKLLQILESQTENQALKNIILAMAEDIREGSSLYDTFKKHPKAFSSLYCSMIQAGETSGSLPEVLDRLSYIIEHEYKVRTNIKSALQYPMIVIIFLFTAFFVLLTFVIPKFVRIFLRSGIDLPYPTRICMALYSFLANYWYIMAGGSLLVVISLAYYLKTDNGKYVRDSLFMKIPILGSMLVKAAMSRFASIFAILQASGVDIMESMKILSGTIGNAAIAREFATLITRLEEGRGISGPLKDSKYFTPIVVNMVGIGEESGNLDEMLGEISAHYDFELEYAMKKLSDAIGPLLTIGLAAVVGFFALAIFLPMWDMTKMVK